MHNKKCTKVYNTILQSLFKYYCGDTYKITCNYIIETNTTDEYYYTLQKHVCKQLNKNIRYCRQKIFSHQNGKKCNNKN